MAAGILALDLSSHTGWAYADPAAARPVYGVWELPAPMVSLGRALAAFENMLLDAFSVHEPGWLLLEAPLPPQAQTNAFTARFQLGLAAIAEAAAWRHDVQVREAKAEEARLAVIGRSRFPKGEAKLHVLNWCAVQGYDVDNDNAADALILQLYGQKTLWRQAA